MAYILNKTNGSVVATVQDGNIDVTTDLTFVGRNYAGYGEIQNENFLKLLENFASPTAPTKAIEGQLWFDSNTNKLNLYNGINWRSVSNLDVSINDPSDEKTYYSGDLWFDSTNEQLYVFNGDNFVLVGPPSSADLVGAWRGSYEYNTSTIGVKQYNIKAIVGTDEQVIAIVSNLTYQVSTSPSSDSYPVAGITDKIVRGITLSGADPETGSSQASGYYFWGTAAESLRANYATSSTYSSGFEFATTSSGLYSVPFINTTTKQAYIDTSTSGIYYDAGANILYTTAAAALYSDLAERYHADNIYGEGTVLVIGGKYDVTISQMEADVSVAGIVSTKPAFRMNESAGGHDTHPFIALKGRVPCKVVGRVHKGDLLVTSRTPGHGRSFEKGDSQNAVFAKALETHHSDSVGIIEVMVV